MPCKVYICGFHNEGMHTTCGHHQACSRGCTCLGVSCKAQMQLTSRSCVDLTAIHGPCAGHKACCNLNNSLLAVLACQSGAAAAAVMKVVWGGHARAVVSNSLLDRRTTKTPDVKTYHCCTGGLLMLCCPAAPTGYSGCFVSASGQTVGTLLAYL